MAKKAPAAVAALVPGRHLALVELLDQHWAIATIDAIAVVTPDEHGWRLAWSRPWYDVAGGDWDEEEHTLKITWVDNSTGATLTTLDDAPKHFPRVFKERVDSSIVYVEFERIPGSRAQLRASVRRKPDGELFSQISATRDVRRTPELDEQLAQLERRLWEIVGL
ncbi:hypothetical protein GCG21_07165 [Pseudactinotalea sp. HY160]|uniref:hypothetical protein n=1 Tax=Pseudactinotalea sp. HY160 TaxID=2654490 RepID=UPI00128BAF0D|nr:hypothetical protein [Pseudactinotalea sp. HY160]MPV49789.1 hypothetical protein [Pseudactinotalea sp. HY160]